MYLKLFRCSKKISEAVYRCLKHVLRHLILLAFKVLSLQIFMNLCIIKLYLLFYCYCYFDSPHLCPCLSFD
uniref:Uncharacterized protein n=1 Tax=Arundo donax TaxID=35708 RepID=A0A0A9DLU6_ARUDO